MRVSAQDLVANPVLANLRARGVSALLAQPGDRLVVALWHELGCGVDAHGASPKALADRVTCAGPASAPALPLALPSSHLAARRLTVANEQDGWSRASDGCYRVTAGLLLA
jgi:hypothetical protein